MSLVTPDATTGLLSLERADLDALTQRARSGTSGNDPVVEGFEALLARKVVQAMRKTVPRSPGGGMTGQGIYDHMIEQSLADHLAAAGGLGLARVFARPEVQSERAITDIQGVPSKPEPGSAERGPQTPSEVQGSNKPLPLSHDLPPQYDPWLDHPDAADILRGRLSAYGSAPSEPARD